MREELEAQFHLAMIGVADFANAHGFGQIFRQMIEEHGVVELPYHFLINSFPFRGSRVSKSD